MNNIPERATVSSSIVFGLASLTLIFPALIVVVNQLRGSAAAASAGEVSFWLVTGAAWVLIVWLSRVARPLATLVLSGFFGGILLVLAIGAIQLWASGSVDLLRAPFGMVALIALNTLGGLVCGLIASWLQSATRKTEP